MGVSARHLLALSESEALIKLHMCNSLGRRRRFELPAAAARQKHIWLLRQEAPSHGLKSFTRLPLPLSLIHSTKVLPFFIFPWKLIKIEYNIF